MDVYIIVIVSAILIMFKFYFKITIKHKYQKDKLIQKENDGNKESLLYKLGNLVDPVTKKYINRYSLIKEGKQRSCVVLYDDPKDMIKYNVYVYNKKFKLIDVLEVKECNSNKVSNHIALKKNAREVNVKVIQVDDITVNRPLHKVSFIKLFLYSIFTFSFIFFSLFILMNLLFDCTREFCVSTSLCFSVIYSFCVLVFLIRKNRMEDDF